MADRRGSPTRQSSWDWLSDGVKVLEPLAGGGTPLGRLDQREGLHLAVDLQGQLAVADHRRRHADVARRPVGQPDVNPLEVGLERPAAHAGGFLAHAAEVFRFAALGLMVAERGLLATDGTFAAHRTASWFPNLETHRRPGRPSPQDRLGLGFSLSFLDSGLCVLLRWILPHSSTRWHTLCGGTASLHWGQIFNAGATRKSWLLRIPCADGDLRRFGTATNPHSQSGLVASNSGEKFYYPHWRRHFKSRFGRSVAWSSRSWLRGASSR